MYVNLWQTNTSPRGATMKRSGYWLLIIAGCFLIGFLGVSGLQAHSPFGHTYVVSTHLSTGEDYRQTWTINPQGTQMDVAIFAGPHIGLRDRVSLHNLEVAKGVWMVNWLALADNPAKGNTISYVVDFNRGKVWGFFTNNASDASKARPLETATGTIELQQ